jgi:hypothetical protein
MIVSVASGFGAHFYLLLVLETFWCIVVSFYLCSPRSASSGLASMSTESRKRPDFGEFDTGLNCTAYWADGSGTVCGEALSAHPCDRGVNFLAASVASAGQ